MEKSYSKSSMFSLLFPEMFQKTTRIILFNVIEMQMYSYFIQNFQIIF